MARAWFDLLEQTYEGKLTWEDLKREFNEEYFSAEAQDELVERFEKIQQGSRTIEEYAFEYNQLCKVVPFQVPTEREKIRRFVKSVRLDIQKYLLSQPYPSVREAIAAARRLERVSVKESGASTGSSGGSSQGSNMGPRKQDFKKKFDNRGKPYGRQPEGANRSNVTCYECGKKGHTRNQCYKTTGGCFKCGDVNHRVGECPKARERQPAPEGQRALPAPEPR